MRLPAARDMTKQKYRASAATTPFYRWSERTVSITSTQSNHRPRGRRTRAHCLLMSQQSACRCWRVAVLRAKRRWRIPCSSGAPPLEGEVVGLAEIPEQTGHDAQPLAHDRAEQMLIGCVLRAAGVGMRHP